MLKSAAKILLGYFSKTDGFGVGAQFGKVLVNISNHFIRSAK